MYIANVSNLKAKLLQFTHGSSWGGHSGFDKTIQRARKEFYWPRLKIDVQKFFQRCDIC